MSSSEYWKKREEEQLKHNITEEEAYTKELNKIYDNMLDSITKEINGFYGRYARSEGISLAEAKKRVAKLDIAAYERKAEKYVKNREFSEQANEEMRLYNATMRINRLEMLKANIGLELIAGHDELEKFMEGILQGRTEDELKRQAGILGKTIKDNAKTAHSIVNASFHNATFSDRIWMYQGMLKSEIAELLQTGLIQGKNPRELAKHLEKRFGVKKSDAERLMRTELARVQTDAQKKSFERNGFEDYTFIVNGGCCPICQGLSGKHFKVKKMMPGTNAPPMHPHCRCSTAAWEDGSEFEAWLDYLDKGGSTESWNVLKERVAMIEKNTKELLENSSKGSIIKIENRAVREWYLNAVSRIKDTVNKKASVEEQAKEAFTARNWIRTMAREMMADEETKTRLYAEKANKTFEELIVSKMQRKNMTREEAIKDIYETATKTNAAVNRELGIGGD